MSERYHELHQRKVSLVAEGETILAATGPNGDLAEDKALRFQAVQNELDSINAALAREEDLREMQRKAALERQPDPAAEIARHLARGERKDQKRFETFGEQLQAIANHGMSGTADPRLIWAAASGANESVPSDGGFLVQKDFSTELMNLAHEMGVILSRVRRIPLSSNSNGIKLPAIDETSRATGSRWGGVRTYWINEADTVAASRPKFRQIELNLNKLMGIAYATEEVLRDAAALETIMRQAFAEEITFSVEDAIVQGDGVGKPLGYLNSPALVTVAKETSQTTSTVIVDNVLKMYSRLPLRSKLNAVWLINAEIEPTLYQMVLGSGVAVANLYRPPGVDTPSQGSVFGTLLGRPVLPVEYAAALGTVGDIQLIDLSQYLLIDKDGVRSDMSMHVRFLYDEQTFRFIYRVDGQPAWQTALSPYKGALSLSPYVTLATRP